MKRLARPHWLINSYEFEITIGKIGLSGVEWVKQSLLINIISLKLMRCICIWMEIKSGMINEGNIA